jgi:hypothetical protein
MKKNQGKFKQSFQYRIVFLFVVGLFFVSKASAQWQPPCEDSVRKNRFFQCYEPRLTPVCGCNQKTYRNQCVSYQMYGINLILSNGVCQQDVFVFDFYPNPATEFINFAVEFFDRGNISVQIFDTYGKLMFLTNKSQVQRYDDVISIGGFRPGLYVVTVTSGNLYKAQKLIVL